MPKKFVENFLLIFFLLGLILIFIQLSVHVSIADENSNISDITLSKNPYYVKRPFGYVAAEESQANLSIIRTYIDWLGEKAVIRGEIKNLDDKTVDVVILTFNLFDANGIQIGNTYASIEYLGPKKSWKFVTDPIGRSDLQFEKYASIFIGKYI